MVPNESHLFHFTDRQGYNSIRAEVDWCFRASPPPPPDHPPGAYFTTLPPHTPNLAKRLRIPRVKLEHVFSFVDLRDLTPLTGGRGEYIYFSRQDYIVERHRQRYCGLSKDYPV
jgi:hypothetical protein